MWSKYHEETKYLIETILILPNEVPYWQFHQERMRFSQMQLGWPDANHFIQHIHSEIISLAHQTNEGIIFRLAWFFSGYRFQYEWSNRSMIQRKSNYSLGISKRYFDLHSQWSNLKHSYRKRYYFTKPHNIPIQDMLFINQNEALVESSIGNIFIKKDHKWFTPCLNSGCVNGVFRKYFLKNHQVKEKVLTQDDLLQGDEVYLGNAIRGLWKCKLSLSEMAH